MFPESARWLFTRGRVDEGKAVINQWARWNKVKLPENFFDKVLAGDEDEGPTQGQIWNLFSSKVMCIRTLLIFVIW